MASAAGPAELHDCVMDADKDADVDHLLGLFDDTPSGDGCEHPPRAAAEAVEQMLKDLRPGPNSVASAQKLKALRGLSCQDVVAKEAAMFDLPDPTIPLPAYVIPVPFVMTASFNLKTNVDLKRVSFGLRHAEFNPRSHPSITIRLVETPKVSALVRASGAVTVSGGPGTTEQSLKMAAKKVARLVQKCGYDEVKFADYRLTGLLCKASLGFPVRLDRVASTYRRNALYEPEIYSGCVFRTAQPRATCLITHGGKVMISGLRKIDHVQDTLHRLYSELCKFQSF